MAANVLGLQALVYQLTMEDYATESREYKIARVLLSDRLARLNPTAGRRLYVFAMAAETVQATTPQSGDAVHADS